MKTVQISCHLIIGAKVVTRFEGAVPYVQGKPTIRVSKGKPSTSPSEVAIALNLELPISLFIKPQLTACISIPAEQVPFQITPIIQENIAEQIRQQTGFDVQITVAPPSEEGGIASSL